MLEAVELTKSYNGTIALDGLNLKIEPGEVFCLLGANGAVKTTTINLLDNLSTHKTRRVQQFLADHPKGPSALHAHLFVVAQPG